MEEENAEKIISSAKRFLRMEEQEADAAIADASMLEKWPQLVPRMQCWQNIVDCCNGAQLSQLDQKHGISDPYQGASLTYGEVRFCPFLGLLSEAISLGEVQHDGSATFVDLGCGAGKALIAAALLPQEFNSSGTRRQYDQSPFFSKCLGVELLPSLAEAASTAGKLLQGATEGHRGAKQRSSASASRVEVMCDDILEVDWSAYDVVYVTTTCMAATLLEGILERAKMLRPGSVLIALQEQSGFFSKSKSTSEWFTHNEYGSFHMNWGHATAHILTRLPAGIRPNSLTPIDVFPNPASGANTGQGLNDMD